MIKKIAIIPYVTNGRNSQVGCDGHLNIFKKKRSTVLKENLQSALASKNQEVEVVIDVNHGDLQFLKREGVNLFLIPEDIASYMDYSGINMEECFKLTHDEYENGNVDRIVKYIEKNWKMVVIVAQLSRQKSKIFIMNWYGSLSENVTKNFVNGRKKYVL